MSLQAATAPEFEKTTGKFLHNGKEMDAPAYAYDRTAQERLWESSEKLMGLTTTQSVTPINDPQLGEDAFTKENCL